MQRLEPGNFWCLTLSPGKFGDGRWGFGIQREPVRWATVLVFYESRRPP